MIDNRPPSELYRLSAKEWVDKDAVANFLEETKSATLSQKMAALGDMPVSRAEMQVKAGEEWKTFIEGMVEARKEANLAKVRMEYYRMKFMEEQSANATRRAEMKL